MQYMLYICLIKSFIDNDITYIIIYNVISDNVSMSKLMYASVVPNQVECSYRILNICIGRALSTLRGLRGAPEVPPLCRETQSLGQQMLNAPVGINGLHKDLTNYNLQNSRSGELPN